MIKEAVTVQVMKGSKGKVIKWEVTVQVMKGR